MDVSSSTNVSSTVQVEALKKSMDVEQNAALKVLESASEQSKEVTAQKTGMGNTLNIQA